MTQSKTTDQAMAPRGTVNDRKQQHDMQNTTKVKQPAF